MTAIWTIVFLVLFLSTAGLGVVLLSKKDQQDDSKFAGGYRFAEQQIEAVLTEDLGPGEISWTTIQPYGEPNVWSVSGGITLQGRAGIADYKPYAAIVLNLCQPFADSNCWHMESLTIGDRVVIRNGLAAKLSQDPVERAPAVAEATTEPDEIDLAAMPETEPADPPPAPAVDAMDRFAASDGEVYAFAPIKTEITATSTTAETKFVIQLAAVRSAVDADGERSRLEKRFADLLGDMELNVQQADVAGVSFFRIRTHLIQSQIAASKICSQLKDDGQDCIVLRLSSKTKP